MTRAIDLTGQRFGQWTVLHKVKQKNGRPAWLCQCDCGNTREIPSYQLRSGGTSKCMRCHLDSLGSNLIDLTGQRFGSWTVLEKAGKRPHFSYWVCQCDCGVIKEVQSQSLRYGNSTMCRSCSLKKKKGMEHPRYRKYLECEGIS